MSSEAGRGAAVAEFAVGGMTCGSCAARLERVLGRRQGVVSASVNYATHRALVSYEAADTTPADLSEAVRRAGYTADLVEDATAAPAAAEPGPRGAVRLALAWTLSLAGTALALGATPRPWVGWAVFGVAVAVQAVAGWPFMRGAVDRLRTRSANMDTLISLATLAALVFSAVEVLGGGGVHHHAGGVADVAHRLHGVMSALVLTVVLTGRHLEARAHRRAVGAMRALVSLRPTTAHLLAGAGERTVAVDTLRTGDLVRVLPGEVIPGDGVVVEGNAWVDESMLTGESAPVPRSPGDPVTGATHAQGGALLVRVTAVGADSVLDRMVATVERAQAGKAPVQRLADRVSAVFVPIVLVLAATTMAVTTIAAHDPQRGALAAVAVLLVACPCAMGLATPVAIMVATGRGASLGILVRSGEVLERAAMVDTVVLDKTGTLTTSTMRLERVLAVPGTKEERLLLMAAAAERLSEHPVGALIRELGESRGPVSAVDEWAAVPGLGVRARVDGVEVIVGRASLLESAGLSVPGLLAAESSAAEREGATVVLVGWEGAARGLIAIADTVRADSRAAVAELRAMGMRTVMLTGDNPGAAAAVARQVGIDEVVAGVLPDAKAAEVRRLRVRGSVVAFVGDGVNDAAALVEADVGIALGSGTDVAVAAAGITLMSAHLRRVGAAFRLARSAHATIIQNLGWAMGYNLSAIPLAALGLLDPLVAALAMGLSSLVVVLNSLRLQRFGRRAGADPARRGAVRRRGALALSLMAPAVGFGVAVIGSQALSPARGQTLLPVTGSPALTSAALGEGARVEAFVDPGRAGANQLHLTFFDAAGDGLAIESLEIVAADRVAGAPPLPLTRLGPDHFVADVSLGPGSRTFRLLVRPAGSWRRSAQLTTTIRR